MSHLNFTVVCRGRADKHIWLKPCWNQRFFFQNHPNSLEIVITWCYRKPFHIKPCCFLIIRVWVKVPILTPCDLTQYNTSACVLRMGCKAVGTVCLPCKARNEPTHRKEKGIGQVFLVWLAAYCAKAPCWSKWIGLIFNNVAIYLARKQNSERFETLIEFAKSA